MRHRLLSLEEALYRKYIELKRGETIRFNWDKTRIVSGTWKEKRNMDDLVISKVDNGWIVTVGCMKFVFDDSNKLSVELSRYLANPLAIREEYAKKYSVLQPKIGYSEGLAKQEVDRDASYYRGERATQRSPSINEDRPR